MSKNHKTMDHSKQHNHKENKNHSNHNDKNNHMGHMGNLRQKFFISLILSIPIILFSSMMGIKLPFQLTFKGSDYLVLIFSTILFLYGGMPFLQGAKTELKNKNPAMMTLISLGISASYIYSIYAFIINNFFPNRPHIMDFFWELATLILIMLLGHWIEMNAVSNASNALKKMAELLPNSAILIDQTGKEIEVSLEKVELGQNLLVKPGEKIPTDGNIISGSTEVNESMLTGESKEVKKNLNDKVIGGSINGSGVITIQVTGTGKSGYLAQVMDLVDNAQKDKSKVETLSDKVAKLLFYIAVIVGLSAFIIWFIITNEIDTAMERMVTVLVIACPHALGLAIPLVAARSTSLGAQNGLLIKNRRALEIAKKVDVVMMDKTGTLTEGNFKVNDYISLNPAYSKEEVLSYMSALEASSSHPLAVGILNKAQELNLKIPKADKIENIAGIGLMGEIDGKDVKITSLSYLSKHNISYDKNLFKELSSKGNSISFLLIDEVLIGLVAQGDEIKLESKAMIQELKAMNIRPIMLTGDNIQVAQVVGKALGIESIFAQLLPENKEKIIKDYMDKNLIVMMVGDGVNDAPSLARANIGVAIGAGTDVAIDSADVILVKDNPSDILHFLNLSKKTSRKMIQNLWWGAGYNIIAIPLAAGILARWKIILSPALGAILMSLSTIIVSINAMLLRLD